MPEQDESTLDLDQPENQRVVRREWWAERVGWLVIAAIWIAALLGLLGPGPLTSRERESSDGRLKVEYYAVPRYSAPAELRIAFEPLGSAEEFIELAISQSILDEIKLESITPAPVESRLGQQRVIHRFRTIDLGDRGHVVYRFEHESFGPLSGSITLLPESEIQLSQFVCP
jgi:hypothetical protein